MAREFDREFKLEAIRMASEEGITAREVDQRLGLSVGIISRWKKQLKDNGDEAFPGTGHLSARDDEVRRLQRELDRVRRERDILKKAVASSTSQRNTFVDATPSLKRSAGETNPNVFRGRSGSPKITEALQRREWRVGKNRVARRMRHLGLRSIVRRRFKVTTHSKHRFPVAPNRLQRDFTAQRPNQVWVSDLTYLRVGRGWLYLVVFIDLFSRRVVGWALSRSLDHTVALKALQRAVARRNPPRGLIHPLRPWCPVRLQRLRPMGHATGLRPEHEPQGRLLGQRRSGVLLPPAQNRTHLPHSLARLRGRAS